MTKEQKRYIIVFTGLFLMVLGGFIYLNSQSKKTNILSEKKKKVNAQLEIFIKKANEVKKPENIFVPYARPTKLNYVYGEDKKFVREIPVTQGMVEYDGDKCLDNLRLVCGGDNCSKQVIVRKDARVYDWATISRMIQSRKQVKITKSSTKKKVKMKVIRGDVVITKGELYNLQPNTKIIGNVYIRNVDSLRIPQNFRVEGDMYVINSEALTFMGDSRVDGQVYVYGKSSIRAVPSSVKISGQIFV